MLSDNANERFRDIDKGFLVDESNYSKTMCQTSCNEHGEMIVVCSIKFKQQQPM